VRRKLIQLGTILILTLCIWGHVSEIFDHWDNTFRTGYDIEYSTVIVALVAGGVLAIVGAVAVAIGTASAASYMLSLFMARPLFSSSPAVLVSHSPPLPLRI
jgi:hypothetical protein